MLFVIFYSYLRQVKNKRCSRTVTDNAAPLLTRHCSVSPFELVQYVAGMHAVHQPLDAQRVGVL